MRKGAYLEVSIARRKMEDKKTDEAIDMYRKILEKRPNDTIVKFELGRALIRDEKTEVEGEEMLNSLLETRNKKFALYELARHAAKKKDKALANDYYNRLIKMGSTDKFLALVDIGRMQALDGEYDEAIETFNKLLSTPFRDTALLEIARIDYIRGNKKKAINSFRSLLFSKTVCDQARLELSKAYFDEEDFSAAKKNLLLLLRSTVKEEALFVLGRVEARCNCFKEARKYFKSIKKYETQPHVLLELGKIEEFIGNFDGASYYFEKLLSTDYEAAGVFELGNVEVARNNLDAAEVLFKSLLDTEKGNVASLRLGRIEVLRKNYTKAMEYFVGAIDSVEASSAILNIIMLEIKCEHYNSAQTLLEKYRDKLEGFTYLQLLSIVNKNLGLEPPINAKSYSLQQTSSYNKDVAVQHIKLHLNENDEKVIHTCFNDDVDLDVLYDEVNAVIQDQEPFGFSTPEKYIIDIGHSLGTADDEETSCMFAVTILGTKNILSMYPVIWYGDSIKIKSNALKKEV